ncbi:MAG: hypothetical protein UZ04_CHB001000090 [Chlorobi bacterium OLB4]|jgi:hypothetical protein|nr:MAG: hypothetical protein UZ04_CHB001000090 [Chlorobi bacterium OLB4]MBV6398525.1 hypothetical protein [Ignavibacteria bacterium]
MIEKGRSLTESVETKVYTKLYIVYIIPDYEMTKFHFRMLY